MTTSWTPGEDVSLRSCREIRAVSLGFHTRAGSGSAFESLQGEPGVFLLLAEYLRQPPVFVDDRFKQELAGQCIQLEDRRRTATCGRREGANFRRHIAAAGVREVHSGMTRWVTRCNGPCFAIGVIQLNAWRELQKDNSMDWPFVGSGFGQGFGLVKRNGKYFVASCPLDGSSFGRSCQADREVCATGLDDAKEFSVVLDMERARVYFKADDSEIPGSAFENIGPETGYRFIASVPPGGSSVTLMEDE